MLIFDITSINYYNIIIIFQQKHNSLWMSILQIKIFYFAKLMIEE